VARFIEFITADKSGLDDYNRYPAILSALPGGISVKTL